MLDECKRNEVFPHTHGGIWEKALWIWFMHSGPGQGSSLRGLQAGLDTVLNPPESAHISITQ